MTKRHFLRFSRTLVLAFLTVVLLVSGAPDRGSAAVSEAEVKADIESRFAVEVLRVRADTIDDRAVWMVTVMNKGGNDNAAFQVNTLAVDRATGELVPSFRHGASGYDLPPRVVPAPDAEAELEGALGGQIWR